MEYTIFSLSKNKEIKSHENKDSEFLNSVEYFDSDLLIICTAKSDKQKKTKSINIRQRKEERPKKFFNITKKKKKFNILEHQV